ncbi:phosphatase PAP2 family protein [Priestia megaterium]|uniref:phosphatase PAP2 family protein n=1 Tax=Priestia megaterium TaxID=1404 RepID=UPI000BF5CDA5|nr:phosphatase PAP2 family protein [Priestia megaterium]PEZ06853.1 phosphatase PAP2 family protein [Priestia megaterium]
MNSQFRFTLSFTLCILFVICFGILSVLMHYQILTQLDHALISLIQGFESSLVTFVMNTFTFIGSTPSVVTLSLLVIFFLYKVLHQRKELILFIAIVGGHVILNQLLKLSFQRDRPNLHRLIEIDGYSFPSGHAMSAFAVYGALSFLLWHDISTRWGRIALILTSSVIILMIGISRIYLGVHYPSDIIGGFLAGGIWLALCIWFYQWYQEKHFAKRCKRIG